MGGGRQLEQRVRLTSEQLYALGRHVEARLAAIEATQQQQRQEKGRPVRQQGSATHNTTSAQAGGGAGVGMWCAGPGTANDDDSAAAAAAAKVSTVEERLRHCDLRLTQLQASAAAANASEQGPAALASWCQRLGAQSAGHDIALRTLQGALELHLQQTSTTAELVRNEEEQRKLHHAQQQQQDEDRQRQQQEAVAAAVKAEAKEAAQQVGDPMQLRVLRSVCI